MEREGLVKGSEFILLLTNRHSPYLSYTARYIAASIEKGYRIYTAMHNNISVDALRIQLAEYCTQSLEELMESQRLSLVYAPDFFLPGKEVVKEAAIRNLETLIARWDEPIRLVADFGWARDYALLPELIDAFQGLYERFAGKVGLLSICYVEDLTLDDVQQIVSCHDQIVFQNGVLFAEFAAAELSTNSKLVGILYGALIDTSHLVHMGQDASFLTLIARDRSTSQRLDGLVKQSISELQQYTRADFGFVALELNSSVEADELVCCGIQADDIRDFVSSVALAWTEGQWPIEPKLLARGDHLLAPLKVPVQSLVMAPLISKRSYQGFFALGSSRPGFPDRLSLSFLHSLGQSLGEVYAARVQQSAALARVSQSGQLYALSALTSSVAHELNNMLTVILTNVQLGSMQGAGELSAERAQLIGSVASEAAALVRRIQSFRRTAGQDQPRELLSFRTLVEDALELARWKWQADAPARRWRTRIELENKSTGSVMGDPTGLRQAIVDIIVTSLEAVAVEPNARMLVSLWDDATHAHVSVSHSGGPLPKEVMEHLFNPLPAEATPWGAKLGLAVASATVQHHGGTISAANGEKGGGVTFTASIPLSSTDDAAPAPSHSSGLWEMESGGLTARRLLIVDDNPYITAATAELLRLAGASTETAASAPDAMALLSAQSFDGVITDHVLPSVTGLVLAQWVKKQSPSTKVALVTGWTAAEQLDASCVDLVLRKPLAREDLRALIKLFQQ